MQCLTYLKYDNSDVFFNFGLEYGLIHDIKPEFPVLLLWRTTPTLMVGRYQSIPAEVNLSFVREHGVTLVRRRSGGGTIYTDENTLQFSIIQKDLSPDISFEQYVAPLVSALQKHGVPAKENGRNDIIVDGKKFSGNAQYREDGYVVHHGSILFDTDLNMLASAIKPDNAKLRSKGIASVHDRVTTLKKYFPQTDILGFRDLLWRELAYDQKQQTPKFLDLPLAYGQMAEDYGLREFKDENKIWGLNPVFTWEKSRLLDGGRVILRLYVEKGLIKNASLEGDFFASLQEGEFAAALKDVPMNETKIREALFAFEFSKRIFRVTVDDIIHMIW